MNPRVPLGSAAGCCGGTRAVVGPLALAGFGFVKVPTPPGTVLGPFMARALEDVAVLQTDR